MCLARYGSLLCFPSRYPDTPTRRTNEGSELAGGYSLMRDYDGDATFPGGWFASVAADVAGPLAVVGDASGSYKSMGGLDVNLSTNIHTFMGGPRLAWRASRVEPYVQMLFGVARFSTTYTLSEERLSRCAELLRDGSRWRHRHPVLGPCRRPSGFEHPLDSIGDVHSDRFRTFHLPRVSIHHGGRHPVIAP